MSQARRFSGPLGGAVTPPAGPAPVRVVDGFAAKLPGRTLRFFQRKFFVSCPRPMQVAGASPWPRRIKIATIQLPKQQSLVLRQVSFAAYQHSGIGIDDMAEVPNGRAIGTLGFEFKMGNQGLTDFSTNLPGQGLPVNYGAAQGSVAVSPQAGEGVTFQGTGVITPGPESNDPDYAAYGVSGTEITATAVVFRPPSFDLRLFSVSFNGWLVEQGHLEKIIDSLSR